MYDYLCSLISVHDGDTLRVLFDVGRDTYEPDTIRLYGVNAPELATDPGKVALAFAQDWLAHHGVATGDRSALSVDGTPYCEIGRPFMDIGVRLGILTHKDSREKYGRYLGTVYDLRDPRQTLNQALLDSGNAVVYLP